MLSQVVLQFLFPACSLIMLSQVVLQFLFSACSLIMLSQVVLQFLFQLAVWSCSHRLCYGFFFQFAVWACMFSISTGACFMEDRAQTCKLYVFPMFDCLKFSLRTIPPTQQPGGRRWGRESEQLVLTVLPIFKCAFLFLVSCAHKKIIILHIIISTGLPINQVIMLLATTHGIQSLKIYYQNYRGFQLVQWFQQL